MAPTQEGKNFDQQAGVQKGQWEVDQDRMKIGMDGGEQGGLLLGV
jgi:hypothetical protein